MRSMKWFAAAVACSAGLAVPALAQTVKVMPLGGKVPVHIPLSGRLMEFDAAGKCAAGC